MIFNSRNITANPTGVEKHKTAPIGGDTLDMDIADHIENKEISVPRVGRVFNSSWQPPTEQEAIDADHKSTMDYMKAFISGDKPETDKAFKALEDHVSQYGDKCTHCKKITGKNSSKVFNSQPLNIGESGGARKKTKGLPFFVKSEGNKMASFNSKLADAPLEPGPKETFTSDNSHFKTHFRLNQGPMKSSYLDKIEDSGEEPSPLADEAFGMGQFSDSGPHPSLLGRSLDQFFGVRLRPKTPEGTSIPTKRRIQQESLSINPEFPKIEEGARRNVDAPFEVTLGHLLQTPSFMVKDENGGTRTLGTTTSPKGNTFDNHPTNSLLKGSLVERRLYHEAMGRLSSHPDIKISDGQINWTPEAHKAVQDEVEKYRRNVQGLYHGNGATLENGTRVRPLYFSKGTTDFITDVDEHFEPHPEDRERWETAKTAFSNTTKGSGIRTMTERAHSPWSQVYDTSFQRRIEESDDSTLKDVFKEHLGERGQHRYIAGAPTTSHAQETSNWKTALEDRLRSGSRGLGNAPTPNLQELARSPKPPKIKRKTFNVAPTPTPIDWESTKNDGTTAKKRIFSSKFKKFFFNSSKTK